MAKELYFPFNAEVIGTSPQGFPVYDREYDAEAFAMDRACFWENGIFPNPSNMLKVESLSGDMMITVQPGRGFINGHIYTLYDGTLSLSIESADPTYQRKDIVVMRLNEVDRLIEIAIKKGVPATTPIAPTLHRNDDIYELKLAEITIQRNAIAILPSNILDTRLDSAVCGIVDHSVKAVDTTDIFNQYYSYLLEKIAEWEAITSDKYDIINSKTDNFLNLVGYLETQAFTLINNNFDDISVKTGTTLSTEWLADGRKMETRVINYNGNILCTRETIWERNSGAAVKTAIVKFYDNVFVINDNMVRSTNSQYREITRYGRVITREVL